MLGVRGALARDKIIYVSLRLFCTLESGSWKLKWQQGKGALQKDGELIAKLGCKPNTHGQNQKRCSRPLTLSLIASDTTRVFQQVATNCNLIPLPCIQRAGCLAALPDPRFFMFDQSHAQPQLLQ